jgi:glycylpeptide N-tetradecanoyltransferase
MADGENNNSTSSSLPGSPGSDLNRTVNHDESEPNSSSPPAESETGIEALARRVQESLSTSKHHKFWETQPVGQFKDLGDSSLPEGPIEQPTPLSEVKQEPYNLPAQYEWSTCDMDDGPTCNEVINWFDLW